MLDKTANAPPHRAILGCTHYPLVEHLFRRHLPAFTRLLPQPEVVADSLEDYLTRHPHYATPGHGSAPLLLTTGNAATVSAGARVFWSNAPDFRNITST
jgi:glutamate racemase